MRVIHLARTFLKRTETFIYTQLSHLPTEKAVALVRNMENQDRFPGVDVRAFSFEPVNWHKRWSGINYHMIRRMTNYERQFYLREIRTLEPDLFHAHFAVDAAYFANVWRPANRPLVVSCYGYDVSSFPNQYAGWGKHYLQPVWRYADLILAMSNDMREDLLRLGCPGEKIRIHYHGIDLTRFKYIERDTAIVPVRILYVGSLNDRKGVEDILLAFVQIASLRPQVELRFVGSGPLRPKLEKLARTWGGEDRISFAGFVRHERLQDEFSSAHIFCHPSRTRTDGAKEGIPGTIVEAMATGLPVVTTKHAGIPEMVRDGEDGFVVAERDLDAIAKSLLTLTDNPEMRIQMGRNAIRRVQQKADSVRLTAELEAIYSSVIASTESGKPS
jgi:colanic acid/amylovoran biosynthesis glycosyltransferase